jgi:hypothetical protein
MNTASRLLCAATLAAASFAATAGPACTEEPQTKWLTEAQMTKIFTDMGYVDDVKKLHVSKGKCWEIYGHEKKTGKKVEIYFHPLTGKVVEANVKD